jgi:monoamine oxidase
MQAGHDVPVLEAQLRPGGRVCTLRAPFSDGLYVEVGAMHIPETHNQIQCGARVIRIGQTDRVVQVFFQGGGTRNSMTADRIVCAIPFSVLRTVEISPPFSLDKRKAIDELPYFFGSGAGLL